MSLRMSMSVSWITSYLLHAWSGCDTTSGTYGMGKIQSGNRCEGVVGCKQTLLPLSRNAIVLSSSVPFFQCSTVSARRLSCHIIFLLRFFCKGFL